MYRKGLIKFPWLLLLVAIMLSATTSFAESNSSMPPPYTDTGHKPVPFKLGMEFDISAPSGVALGVMARLPKLPWFKLGLAATGTLAPGVRGNLLIDPIKFPIAPVANIDVGHQFGFKVPSVDNSPKIAFTYCDLQGGLGLGSRDGFRFMLMAGFSYLAGTAYNFQGLVPATKGLTVMDPHFTGWIPNAKLGFSYLF